MTTPFHVLIIGGGIGGLCLAHGLAAAGISVAVSERDKSAEVRRQGYRISLKETGARALHNCLPGHLFDLCVATSLRQATRMVFTDERLTPKFAKPIPPIEPGMAGFGVNRLTLREVLLGGLDGLVHFGKTFQRYEYTTGGRVRAFFADGTSAEADLLVGADGTNSAVRRQLLPDAVIDELHWAIYGTTPIAADTLDWVPDVLIDTFNRVIGPGEAAAIAVATCRTREPAAEAAARLAPRLRLTDIPGYLSWTVSGTTQLPGEGVHHADAAALHRLARDMVARWHPGLRRIIDHADVAATFPVRVTTARPIKPWDEPAVTLLGDAIHTMSPGRGDGANIALKDAQLLRTHLTEAAAGRASIAQAKTRYEAEMLRYGFEAVKMSLNKPFAPANRAPR